MSILNLNGGFLGDIEVHYSILPAEPQNDAREEFEIQTIMINGKAISQLSQEQFLGVFVYFGDWNPDKYSIREIIELKIKEG